MGNFKEALDRLKTIAETLPDDDPDKLDMLNIEGDFTSLMNWVLQKYNDAKLLEIGAKAMKDKYADREKAAKNRQGNLKDLIHTILISAGEDSFKSGIGTASLRKLPPKPLVIDEDKIPDEYFKVTRTLQKSEINKAIKNGAQIDGVSMDNGGQSLTIRI